jgi:molecular chaperone GrpE
MLDNFERAIRHLPPGPMTTGVRLVEKDLLAALEKHTLSRFSAPKGTRFDPSIHDAVDQVETAEIEPGAVAEEFASGYMHGSRLLRAALVAVATAPRERPTSEGGKVGEEEA